jgi:hypothetical protein
MRAANVVGPLVPDFVSQVKPAVSIGEELIMQPTVYSEWVKTGG